MRELLRGVFVEVDSSELGSVDEEVLDSLTDWELDFWVARDRV